jgi:hypothetical protein
MGSVKGVCGRKRAVHLDSPYRLRVRSASACEIVSVRHVPTSGDLSDNAADAPAARTDADAAAATPTRMELMSNTPSGLYVLSRRDQLQLRAQARG